MATTTVQFTQDGNDYHSDLITADSAAVVFHVTFRGRGEILLERSITESEFTPVKTMRVDSGEQNFIEFQVSGVKPEQNLRLHFKYVIPELITIL